MQCSAVQPWHTTATAGKTSEKADVSSALVVVGARVSRSGLAIVSSWPSTRFEKVSPVATTYVKTLSVLHVDVLGY